MNDTDPLWHPTTELCASANITHFARWLESSGRSPPLPDYRDLWQWSVDHPATFWAAIRDHYSVAPGQVAETVMTGAAMPDVHWFPGVSVNFAGYLLAQGQADHVAVYHESESEAPGQLTWGELRDQVAALASWLRRQGIEPGDRVCAYLPTCPEALVAMLASTAIGAIWSCCSPDFGSRSVIERFQQIAPRVLIAVGNYRYHGRDQERAAVLRDIIAGLPALEQVVYLPRLDRAAPRLPAVHCTLWATALGETAGQWQRFEATPVPFEHPLWILYTSGTTGLPKGIVHGHGGILLEFLKHSWLHDNLGPESIKFFFTSTGWTMFNLLVGGMVTGCAVVLYDGSPFWPDQGVLWDINARYRCTYSGANPAYIQRLINDGHSPRSHHDLSQVRTFSLTGSPATRETCHWLYREVNEDMHVVSMSGGTDVAAAAFDNAGQPLLGEDGELVITRALPSMPLFLWADDDGERYRSSYFDLYPGIWRQGDQITFYPDMSCVISGRSDATLNRNGIRIGTAEVYHSVAAVEGVLDCLIVNVDIADSTEAWLPLFVVLQEGQTLEPRLEALIRQRLRDDCSPRHVPDAIVPVAAIPYTLAGKRLEVPVKRLLMGWPLERAVNIGAVANPEALTPFIELARSRMG